jgi:hypothetical protein
MEDQWFAAGETFVVGLLWGCFTTALVLKRNDIRRVCCDGGAKISSTHQPTYAGDSEDPAHLETDDDAHMQAAIADSINRAEGEEEEPPPIGTIGARPAARAAHNGAGPSNYADIELVEVKPTRSEL